MGPAVADVVSPHVLDGLTRECRGHQPDAGVDAGDALRDDPSWCPATVPVTASRGLAEPVRGLARQAHAMGVMVNNDRIKSNAALTLLIEEEG
jgi:hypothetical protein